MNVYLDHNAGAPLRREAFEAMTEVAGLLRAGGNASSPHANGRAVRAVIEEAREAVAGLMGADAENVTFTSGATEAAATVLAGGWDAVICSGLEHDCVRASAGGLAHSVPVLPSGVVDLDALRRMLRQTAGNRLAAITAASNETGAIQPVAEAAAISREAGAYFLCDATQILGRAAFGIRDSGIDYAICSAQKLGGPPGTGAVVRRDGRTLSPLIRGGGQENWRRAGTENVVGIAGFAAAARAALAEDWRGVAERRDRFERDLAGAIPGVRFYATGMPRLPNTSCFSVPGWSAETLVIALDLEGFSIGAGAACSSGKAVPGRALVAMGFGEDAARAALRLSIGLDTGEEQLAGLCQTLCRLVVRRERLAA